MRNISISIILIWILAIPLQAQVTFPRNDVMDKREGAYAFTNATIVVDATSTITNATLLIRKGKVENVGAGLAVPAGYIEINVDGKHIYPGFVDAYTNYGLPKVERARRNFNRSEQIQSNTSGAYNSNQAIRSEYNASEEFSVDSKSAEEMRKLGFGTVLTFKADGLARGSSAIVTLADNGDNNAMVMEKAAAHYSFNKGSSTQNYPSSPMGFIALLRQTYMDADWYGRQNPKPFTDQSLQSWIDNQNIPQIFESNGWITALRADKLGDEFGKQYIIKVGGDEYQRIDLVKATNAQLIVPVTYPDAYDVDDPFDAASVSLADMKHWEMAPTNLAALEKSGIRFAITSYGLSKKSEFLTNIRKAVKMGLSEQAALQALTSNPASMLNISNQVGSLRAGMMANLVITSGSIFEDKSEIIENWVQGNRYRIKDLVEIDNSGDYNLSFNGQTHDLKLKGNSAEISVNDTTAIKVDMTSSDNLITLSFEPTKGEGRVRLSGWTNDSGFTGEGQLVDGTWVNWSATKQGDSSDEEETNGRGRGSDTDTSVGSLIYPFVAHGTATLPQTETILIKNATVWTNEADGILENTDVLLEDGKISRIGKDLNARNARVIDGTGKHLTPGIIDEHSHLAASSINDVATNSSMVRIGDVVDSEDFGVYRALGGGVVAAQILHGSANPIGGQSAIIKMRWGVSPEEMKIQGADGFIKFALGENVKRARSTTSIRYPQTRMGVEQVFVDAFTNAREYGKEWAAYNGLSSRVKATAMAPRRDLVHETMLEILEGKRFISCHSYVQSEINMLMKVAERFDFRVNTFTHILEGYKVADKMKEHGVGGSTFSDWWNYKWEVRYAIPYNAAIMHNEGVVTALNSDSGEVIRRLNQEAGKAVKYGGVDEQDALKMVTLNPAKLLHLDDEMGSLKTGKSADVVLWTDHPLSIYAKADKTIIDGKVYFDLEKDAQVNVEIASERARLIAKMKGAKKGGARMQRGGSAEKIDFICEDVLGEEADMTFRQ